jgi:hypothetical protein
MSVDFLDVSASEDDTTRDGSESQTASSQGDESCGSQFFWTLNNIYVYHSREHGDR